MAIAALPSHARPAIELLFDAYDALLTVRQAAERELVQEVHRHAISRTLESCPGFGPISSLQDDPMRCCEMQVPARRE